MILIFYVILLQILKVSIILIFVTYNFFSIIIVLMKQPFTNCALSQSAVPTSTVTETVGN